MAHLCMYPDDFSAMDTLYITTAEGKKIEDPALLQTLTDQFTTLISRPETSD